jgi:hypothetical protein
MTQLQIRNTTDITTVMPVAQAMVKSGMFKDVTSEAQAVVKVLYGLELGLPPVYSMMNVYFVNGKLGSSANMLARLIQQSGKYRYVTAENSDTKAVIEFYESINQKWEKTYTSEFNLDDAKRAGLLGGTNWQKYPADMLWARALSRGARKACPDAVGSVYLKEELESIEPFEQTQAKPISRKAKPAVSEPATPAVDDTKEQAEPPPATEPAIEQPATPQIEASAPAPAQTPDPPPKKPSPAKGNKPPTLQERWDELRKASAERGYDDRMFFAWFTQRGYRAIEVDGQPTLTKPPLGITIEAIDEAIANVKKRKPSKQSA